MYYAKIKNQQILQFPYNILNLFDECPEARPTGFDGEIEIDIVNVFNNSERSKRDNSIIVAVNLNDMPDYDNKKQVPTGEYSFEFINEQWTASYILREIA